MGSTEEGMKDGSKGEKNYWEYGLNEEYRRAYDHAEGSRTRQQYDHDMETQSLDRIAADAIFGRSGLEQLGKSKEFKRGYSREPLGDSKRGKSNDEDTSSYRSPSSYSGGSDYSSGGSSSYWPQTQTKTSTASEKPVPGSRFWFVGISLGLLLYASVSLGFLFNYGIGRPDEASLTNTGNILSFIVLVGALLIAVLERGFWVGFLAGGSILGIGLGLYLFPISDPYLTPVVSGGGWIFPLGYGLLGWIARLIFRGSNRSAGLSALLALSLLLSLAWLESTTHLPSLVLETILETLSLQ